MPQGQITRSPEVFDVIDVRQPREYCFRPWNSSDIRKYQKPLSITKESGPRLVEVWARGYPGAPFVLIYQERAFTAWNKKFSIPYKVGDPLYVTSVPTQPPLPSPEPVVNLESESFLGRLRRLFFGE